MKRRISNFPRCVSLGQGWVLTLTGLLALLSLGCEISLGKDKKKDKEDEAAYVQVEPVRVERVGRAVTATAVLLAEREVEVFSRVEGQVEHVNAEEGARVREGDVLVKLHSEEKRLLAEQARLRAENAARDLERNRSLMEQGLISSVEFERLEYQADLAKADLEVARYNLSETFVRAPFSGIVTFRGVQIGQTIRPGQLVYRLAKDRPLEAFLYLTEKDVRFVREGMPASLTLDADAGVDFEGRVHLVSPVVDAATGTVKVTVRADAPPEGVRPGSFVRARLTVEERDDALLVPRRALLQSPGKNEVFVMNGDDAVKKVEVSTGHEKGDLIEVRAGITATDRVVTFGKEILRDGAKVRIAPPPESNPVAKAEDEQAS